MRKLAKTFKQKGFNFSQIKREGNKAIYKKTPINSDFVSYETIIVSSHTGYSLGDQYIEPAETYPSNSQWGTKGWTHSTLQEAELKYNKLKP